MLLAKRPLKRSVMLIAFSAEETGLLGSKYYVEHPTVPLDDTIAMINMDMVGRFDEDSKTLQVFGTKAAEEFDALIASHVEDAGMVLRGSESAIGPSDHTPFYEKKIPAMHVFTVCTRITTAQVTTLRKSTPPAAPVLSMSLRPSPMTSSNAMTA